MDLTQIKNDALDVLKSNDLGNWTQPAPGLYPHQWLWDSCFIAIGLSHNDVARAQEEIRSLIKGQWDNGMIPHIIFSDANGYHAGPWLWNSHVNPHASKAIQTSGITQPPVLAEACVRIGKQLDPADRIEWYKEVFPAIADYHEWLYTERDPDGDGLVVVVHPWETGLDNTPPWMELLKRYTDTLPWKIMNTLKLTDFIERFRRDTSVVPPNERMSTQDLSAVYLLVQQLQYHKYNGDQILKNQKVLLVDLSFNCILMRANRLLAEIADEIDQTLPPKTAYALEKGVELLETFFDKDSGQYFSIDYKTGKHIKVDSIAGLLPLYAATLEPEKRTLLLNQLEDPSTFSTPYSVPTAPRNSPYFKPHCYWQGPVWINTNWLLIDGLKRNKHMRQAGLIKQSTLQLVSQNGMNEYFSPIDGSPAGISNFSWTAALALDLISQDLA